MSANLTVPPEFERASKELRERLRQYREGAKPGEPWSVVRDELLAKLRGG